MLRRFGPATLAGSQGLRRQGVVGNVYGYTQSNVSGGAPTRQRHGRCVRFWPPGRATTMSRSTPDMGKPPTGPAGITKERKRQRHRQCNRKGIALPSPTPRPVASYSDRHRRQQLQRRRGQWVRRHSQAAPVGTVAGYAKATAAGFNATVVSKGIDPSTFSAGSAAAAQVGSIGAGTGIYGYAYGSTETAGGRRRYRTLTALLAQAVFAGYGLTKSNTGTIGEISGWRQELRVRLQQQGHLLRLRSPDSTTVISILETARLRAP